MSEPRDLITLDEVATLIALAHQAPRQGRVVELGTFAGRTTASLCAAVGSSRVISFDNYKMQHHGESSLALAAAYLHNSGYSPLLLKANSHTPVDVPVALLFVDSHHHPDTLHNELAVYLPLIVPDGIIAFHDYNRRKEYPGYSEKIDRIFAKSTWRRVALKGSLIAFQAPAEEEDAAERTKLLS